MEASPSLVVDISVGTVFDGLSELTAEAVRLREFERRTDDSADCNVLLEVEATGIGGKSALECGSSGLILNIEVWGEDRAVDLRTVLRLSTDARSDVGAETMEKASLSTLWILVFESFRPVLVVCRGGTAVDCKRSSTACSNSAKGAFQ